MTKKKILAKAEGIKVHKGNPKKATSLNKVCSGLKAKYPIKMKDLLSCL